VADDDKTLISLNYKWYWL